MRYCSQAAVERAMKRQEVILRAIAKKITWWQAAKILGIGCRQMRRVREQYFDFNVRHFHERLREDHGITLSYTWVKKALQESGLVKKTRTRRVHRKRRE